MSSSIQDYAKKINSRITLFDCVSLLITTIFLLFFLSFLYVQKKEGDIPVTYQVALPEKGTVFPEINAKPFASIFGKTYTFSWCSGGNTISSKNMIFFSSEEEAKRSGRTLSKLCKK